MSDRYIAIHESSHAVSGLCLGRRTALKNLSIASTLEMKGEYDRRVRSERRKGDALVNVVRIGNRVSGPLWTISLSGSIIIGDLGSDMTSVRSSGILVPRIRLAVST